MLSDIIKLLPDSLANQIAAGEVVQRPAAAVKELMENAIDSGAGHITLQIRDGGKAGIMVTDDGCGMSPTDARMSFERHATSKLNTSLDLFNIRTMGFRGEALASIAAVAQVDMLTRRASDEMGTHIMIEGSKIVKQEAKQASPGTMIHVRNLFFNIPARRNFLKSVEVERKHCYEEFTRIALAYPSIRFTLINQDETVQLLLPSSHKQRIAELFRKDTMAHLLDVYEEVGEYKITGCIGTPELARRSRGEQYLFVNNRFIRSHLLNHAVQSAYDRLIPVDHFAFFILFIQCPTGRIDVNVHPSKQEIKFDDDNLIYTYIKSAVKHTLAHNLVSPALDFDKDEQMTQQWNQPGTATGSGQAIKDQYRIPGNFYKENASRWRDLYDNLEVRPVSDQHQPVQTVVFQSEMNDEPADIPVADALNDLLQIHQKYILCPVKSGMMVIDQQAAHRRILYDEFLAQSKRQQVSSQLTMFPVEFSCSDTDDILLQSRLSGFNKIGFDLVRMGDGKYKVNAYPAFFESEMNIADFLHDVLEQLELNPDIEIDTDNVMANVYASKAAFPAGRKLSAAEMRHLIDRLFATSFPSQNARGEKCFIIMSLNDIDKNFI